MMTRVLGMLLLTGLVVGCNEPEASAPPVATTPAAFNAADKPTVEYDVPGLHCENCSATACNLLADLPGVVDVKADAETKKATVAIDESQFDTEAAREALEGQFGEATVATGQASDVAETTEAS